MTTRPMALPVPALVGITDTNALASRACHAASNSLAEDLFTGLAATGRSNTYVSAHVPEELLRHLAEVAAHYPGLQVRDAERVLWNDIMARVPVIDLAVGDYLHPRIRPLMRSDPEMPLRLRGDSDDIGTAALAEFLAPSVIISADSVFTRFGLADTVATTWLPGAYSLLKAAGFEATLTEAAYLIEVAGRLLAALTRTAVSAVRRYPLPALGIGAVVVFLAYRAGYLDRSRLPALGRQVGHAATEGLDRWANAYGGYEQARAALRVIEPHGAPTIEQLAARYLARTRRPIPLRDLAAALEDRGYMVTAAEIREATDRHPAFWMKGKSPSMVGVGRLAIPREEILRTPRTVSHPTELGLEWQQSVPIPG